VAARKAMRRLVGSRVRPGSVIPRCDDVRVTTYSRPGADGAGRRKSLSPAMLAALWTVSNGRCYAPGCVMPVVLEVRPGVYQKNSQVAHIYGIRPGTPRYRPDMPARERDSFANLLLLCTLCRRRHKRHSSSRFLKLFRSGTGMLSSYRRLRLFRPCMCATSARETHRPPAHSMMRFLQPGA